MTDSRFDNMKPWQVFIARLLLSVDQLVNVLLLGFPDETLSGRLGRAHQSGKPKWYAKYLRLIVDKLAIIISGERDHCVNAIEPEDRFDQRRELWKWHD